jgi:colanic acid biosynthesis glycosyl transferase WcaI
MSAAVVPRHERTPARPRLQVLSLVFSPDGVSTAQLMTELATDLHRTTFDVSVVTTRPHYNRDAVAEARQPLTRLWPGLLWRSEIEGVTVYHTRAPVRAGGILRRAFGWALFHAIALVAALRLVRRADVIFVPSPLLTLGALGRLLQVPLRGRMVYNVQELYPDLAVEAGLIRNPLLVRVLRRLERYVYDHAAAVTAITDGIRDAIVAKGIAPSKVVTLPNFVDVSDLSPQPKANAFAAEHGWTSRFVVLYAGNMGHLQGLDVLLDAAVAMRDAPEVLFAFVGEGVAKPDLERRAADLRLDNVAFVAHQPYARVPQIYASSDLCVVSLAGEVRTGALPSKVFRIMACGRPVLALCEPDSDLAALVRDAGAGAVCAPTDAPGIVAAVRALRGDAALGAAQGARGRRYVEERLSREAITDRYAALLTGLPAVEGRA